MTDYIQFFVVPVPERNIEAYRKQSALWRTVFLDHGALAAEEFEGDDVPAGKTTSFPQSVDLKPGEKVFVGYTTFKSRAHRDEVSKKAMQDTRFAGMSPDKMPFDGRRMYFGGFKPFTG